MDLLQAHTVQNTLSVCAETLQYDDYCVYRRLLNVRLCEFLPNVMAISSVNHHLA